MKLDSEKRATTVSIGDGFRDPYGKILTEISSY